MHNEDAVLLRPPLLAVADGVGGRPAGERAATLVLEVLRDHQLSTESRSAEHALVEAMSRANAAVRASARGRWCEGMATTALAALLAPGRVTVAHVGDSRAYLWRAGVLRALTADHRLVRLLVEDGDLAEERARLHPMRGVIVRAIGMAPAVRADVATYATSPGDLLLLCTDGLTDPLEDDTIAAQCSGEPHLDRLVGGLVDAAVDTGGRDDITVVAARLE